MGIGMPGGGLFSGSGIIVILAYDDKKSSRRMRRVDEDDARPAELGSDGAKDDARGDIARARAARTRNCMLCPDAGFRDCLEVRALKTKDLLFRDYKQLFILLIQLQICERVDEDDARPAEVGRPTLLLSPEEKAARRKWNMYVYVYVYYESIKREHYHQKRNTYRRGKTRLIFFFKNNGGKVEKGLTSR